MFRLVSANAIMRSRAEEECRVRRMVHWIVIVALLAFSVGNAHASDRAAGFCSETAAQFEDSSANLDSIDLHSAHCALPTLDPSPAAFSLPVPPRPAFHLGLDVRHPEASLATEPPPPKPAA